ncbi:polyhydroxyalkanoic acid synthase subunit PhaR [Priestia endophytica]|jgi:polyhydroxyalkanoic acid synthase PhaR subunit|uniref:polyhydroxyalkanoic acid synthase subunit PhaR n=1 Tax=Priestia endophytica TaxID=135735 RepID=UPI000F51DBBA|nr:polyhydroxyalkanoic acid synthase subunit PhaR [Priestia endophytica]MED4072397.1 polyhydroxyalkanoic acid synthase subunit PhaR [Priestia endophytica]RPK12706.1 hypothetical protein FH5_02912 [Priestia endophytica]
MDQQKLFDPFLAWKDMYDKSESYWGKVLGENMKKDEFSDWMGKVLNLNLQYQQAVNEVTTKCLEHINIPSKEDIANVATLVVNVEEKVDFLEERFDNLEDEQSNAPNFKREFTKIKSDVKALDKKLDQVVQLLQAQQQLQETLPETLREELSSQNEKIKKLDQVMELLQAQQQLQEALPETLREELSSQNEQIQSTIKDNVKQSAGAETAASSEKGEAKNQKQAGNLPKQQQQSSSKK